MSLLNYAISRNNDITPTAAANQNVSKNQKINVRLYVVTLTSILCIFLQCKKRIFYFRYPKIKPIPKILFFGSNLQI